MTAVLAVLRVIGIVLLVLLALVLLVLCVVLFVPVRFALDAEVPETLLEENALQRLKEAVTANARFHWLFHAVRGSVAYPGDLAFTVKALWMTLLPKEEKPEGDSAESKKRNNTAKAERGSEKGEKNEISRSEAESTATEEETEKRTVSTQDKKEESGKTYGNSVKAERKKTSARQRTRHTAKPEKQETAAPKAAREKETTPLYERLADFFGFLFRAGTAILTKPYEVFFKIWYTISSVCDKIEEVRLFLGSETFERAKQTVLKQVRRLLKGVAPKKCDIRVLYGTGNPAQTGQVLAAYSVLYPMLGAYLTPEADFERKVIGGHAHVRGRVTIFRILLCAGLVWFNKDVRACYQKAKRMLSAETEAPAEESV